MNKSYFFSHLGRASLLPLVLIFGIAFILYNFSVNLASPVKKQRIGWQEWSVVSYPKPPSPSQIPVDHPADNEDVDLGGSEDGSLTGGIQGGDATSFAPSYDMATWDPLIPHTTGLTAIEVKGCYLPSWIYPSFCAPSTTPDEDKLLGRWVRIDKDLNVKTGLWYLNVYYRRTRRFDVPLITDLLWLEEGESPPGNVNLTEYTMAKGNWRDGVWPKRKAMRLWYKLKAPTGPGNWDWWKRSPSPLSVKSLEMKRKLPLSRGTNAGMAMRKRQEDDFIDWDWNPSSATSDESNSDSEPEPSSPYDEDVPVSTSYDSETSEDETEALEELLDEIFDEPPSFYYDNDDIVTELDVLYGDNEPWFGFERISGGPMLPAEMGRWDSVDLTVRKGNPVAPYASTLRFSSSGNFKILQIADLHFSVSNGTCRDTPKNPCVGDVDTLSLIGRVLDAERPDLVVFSGDQLNGQGTSWDSRSVLGKFAGEVIKREIPWTAIFGNHDSEIAGDRAYQMRMVSSMPYSMAEAGPSDVDGVGNYHVRIYSGDSSYIHLFTLYFLDSHDYQKAALPWLKADYDYLKPSQISWYLNESSSVKPISRPFSPDGGEDLGHIWKSRRPGPKRQEMAEPPKLLAKPNAMAFLHIPLPEAYDRPDDDSLTGDELEYGSQLDGAGNSKTNGEFFENGIRKAFEVDEDVLEGEGVEGVELRTEVKVIGFGHCHNTDRCSRIKGVWMCFGGGGSYSGYGDVDFERRFRVYELSDYGETITSYKRTEGGDIVDRRVLVGNGAPSGWGVG